MVTDTPVNEAGAFDANGFSLWFGYGKVNALKAVQAAVVPATTRKVDITANTAVDIRDGGTAESPLAVEETGTITDLRAQVDITHSFIGDLRVDLVAPDGTAVTLHNHSGGSAHDLSETFSEATVPALRGLFDKPIQGTWRLRVTDSFRFDDGRVKSWRLVARVTANPPS